MFFFTFTKLPHQTENKYFQIEIAYQLSRTRRLRTRVITSLCPCFTMRNIFQQHATTDRSSNDLLLVSHVPVFCPNYRKISN